MAEGNGAGTGGGCGLELKRLREIGRRRREIGKGGSEGRAANVCRLVRLLCKTSVEVARQSKQE